MQKNTVFSGAEAQNRTADLLITNPLGPFKVITLCVFLAIFCCWTRYTCTTEHNEGGLIPTKAPQSQ